MYRNLVRTYADLSNNILKIKDNFSSQLSQRSYYAHCTKINDTLGMYCLYNKRLTVLAMKQSCPFAQIKNLAMKT